MENVLLPPAASIVVFHEQAREPLPKHIFDKHVSSSTSPLRRLSFRPMEVRTPNAKAPHLTWTSYDIASPWAYSTVLSFTRVTLDAPIPYHTLPSLQQYLPFDALLPYPTFFYYNLLP